MSHKCDYCGLISPYKQSIVRHIKNKHNPKMCKTCKSNFSSDNELRLHSLTSHNMCLNCDKHIERNHNRHIETCDKKLCRKFVFDDDENIKSLVLTKLKNSPLPIKWILNRKVNFVKYSVESDGTSQIYKETSAVFRHFTLDSYNFD